MMVSIHEWLNLGVPMMGIVVYLGHIGVLDVWERLYRPDTPYLYLFLFP